MPNLLKECNLFIYACLAVKIFILCISLWLVLKWSRCAKNLAYRNRVWIVRKRENPPPVREGFPQDVYHSSTQGLIWNACYQPVCEHNLYLNVSFLPVMVLYGGPWWVMYQYLINFSLLNIVKIYQEDWQKETDTLSARRNSTNHTWGGLSCFYL